MNKSYTFNCEDKAQIVADTLESRGHFHTIDAFTSLLTVCDGKWVDRDMEVLHEVLAIHDLLPITIDMESDSYEKATYELTVDGYSRTYYEQFENSCENCGEFYHIPDYHKPPVEASEDEDCFCPACRE